MADDKKKAEHRFNSQAIQESVERMKPELIAASEAAHKMKDADSEEDDPDYAEFDRTMELWLSSRIFSRAYVAHTYGCLTRL